MEKSMEREIINLRISRKGYGEIGQILGISSNTVKSFCLRNGLGDEYLKGPEPSRLTKLKPKKEIPLVGHCLDCGTVFVQNSHGSRKFCSQLCAGRWRRKHSAGKFRKICPICGKSYPVFDTRKERMYCSLDCYRTARYYSDGTPRTHEVACETCGKVMTLSGKKKRRFCSPECYFASLSVGKMCDTSMTVKGL